MPLKGYPWIPDAAAEKAEKELLEENREEKVIPVKKLCQLLAGIP